MYTYTYVCMCVCVIVVDESHCAESGEMKNLSSKIITLHTIKTDVHVIDIGTCIYLKGALRNCASAYRLKRTDPWRETKRCTSL